VAHGVFSKPEIEVAGRSHALAAGEATSHPAF